MQCYLPERLNLTGNLAENWRVFKQALEIYLLAAGLETKCEKRKLAILLNFMGEDGIKIYNNFNLTEEEKTYTRVLEELQKYCEPKRNILYSRYLFYKREQAEGETIDMFLTDVTKLVKNCAFSSEEESLRDKLVLGTTDLRTQSKLLVEGDLTLEEVIKRLRIAELDKKHIEHVQASSRPEPVKVDAVNKEKFNFKEKRLINCKWCGLQHAANLEKCPARGKECTKCGRMNHFAKVCYSKSRNVRAVCHNKTATPESDEEDFYCGKVVELNGTLWHVGLTLTAGALPAVPALWWAEALVDYIGHSNIFITAFIFYCLRYTGLAYSTDYSWIVVCEVLEVFTMSLVWVTAVLYFRHLVPRKYTTTGQALPVIAHFCIGRCIGAIVSGLVSVSEPLESAREAYRALGACALGAAAVYAALYHLLLAPRCAARPAPPPHHLLQGLNTNGGSNGTYSPMRVYHEERSRKGHFRY